MVWNNVLNMRLYEFDNSMLYGLIMKRNESMISEMNMICNCIIDTLLTIRAEVDIVGTP